MGVSDKFFYKSSSLFSALQLFNKIKSAGYHVVSIIHDKDASTMKHAKEVFGDTCQERYCLNHRKGSIQKRLIEKAKTAPRLKGLEKKFCKYLSIRVKRCENDEFILGVDLLNLLDHFQNNHTFCDETCPYRQTDDEAPTKTMKHFLNPDDSDDQAAITLLSNVIMVSSYLII